MKKIVLILTIVLAAGPLRAEELPPLPDTPLYLTSVTPEMLEASYWIQRLPEPDKVIFTPQELEKFNAQIRRVVRDQVDIFTMSSTMSGKQLSDLLQMEFKTLRGRKLFDVKNKPVPKELFDQDIKPIINVEKIPASVKLKWGVAVRPTSVRAVPTHVKMLEEIGDVEFDQLQFTLIKLWTPVGIFHASSDGKWLYIQAPYSRGWVKASDIALFEDRKELKEYVKSDKFIVVTGESLPVFAQPSLEKIIQRPSMGTILPLAPSDKGGVTVWMPSRGEKGQVQLSKGYVAPRADFSRGFPPFTQRNIINQAFKLLGARYGWGGMYNGRDCSGFTHDVFLSMGVDMPRNSKPQSFVGTQLNHFEPFQGEQEKFITLREATPALTLLRMPMHMMLYLGEVNGNFYVIHSTWAERISMTSDEKNRINQVVVSDLNLNGKSRIGSLFDRIVTVNEISS